MSFEEKKRLLIKVLVETLVVENVKFQFSFFTSFSINKIENSALQGFTQMLRMIARDENFHINTHRKVFKILRNNKQEGFTDTLKKLEGWVIDYLNSVEAEEKKWVDYLLKDGELPSFSKDICYNFIEYYIDDTLKILGLPPKHNHKSNDTIHWYKSYKNIDEQETSLQEVSNNNYELGVFTDDCDNDTLERLKVSYLKD